MNRKPRTLHLLDIENLIGSGRLDRSMATDCLAAYDRAAGRDDADHVIVAANPFVALDVGLAAGSARLLTRHGADGADLELVAVLETERVDDRFDAVVLGSGDGRFTAAAIALHQAGLTVRVVGRRGQIAKRLMMAASAVTYIDDYSTEPAALPVSHLPQKAA